MTIIEQYKQAVETANALAVQLQAEFMALPSLEEKFKVVLQHGSGFLREESWYCPHVRTSEGEVCMHDDLYVQRYETLTLDRLMESIYDDFDGIDWDSEDYPDRQIELAGATVNLDTPCGAVLRDMLAKGIGRGTFDW